MNRIFALDITMLFIAIAHNQSKAQQQQPGGYGTQGFPSPGRSADLAEQNSVDDTSQDNPIENNNNGVPSTENNANPRRRNRPESRPNQLPVNPAVAPRGSNPQSNSPFHGPGGGMSRQRPQHPEHPQNRQRGRPLQNQPEQPQSAGPIHSETLHDNELGSRPTGDIPTRTQSGQPRAPAPQRPGMQAPNLQREPRRPEQQSEDGPKQPRQLPTNPQRAPHKPELPGSRVGEYPDGERYRDEEDPKRREGGEHKRSSQGPGRGYDPRNTVCESVCACQQLAAYCNNANLRSLPEPFPPNLNSITIEGNPLEVIPQNTFHGTEFSTVTTLHMAENKIKTIERKAFSGLSSVRDISLRGNKISTIADDAFQDLNNLQTLVLSSNNLKELNPNAFNSGLQIRNIALEDNNLKEFPSELFDVLSTLTDLHLGGNPWKCNCNLLGLFVWLSSGSTRLHGKTAECASPNKWKGRRLDSFDNKDMQAICTEDDGEEEEESEEEKIEENCSDHSATDPVNICYISETVYSQPGKQVCIHCAATIADEYSDSDESESELILEWKVPSHLNSRRKDGEMNDTNGTYCVETVTGHDSGLYTCIATYGNFTDEKSVKIQVNDLANKVAIGLAIFIALTVMLAIILIVRWWAGELRGMKNS